MMFSFMQLNDVKKHQILLILQTKLISIIIKTYHRAPTDSQLPVLPKNVCLKPKLSSDRPIQYCVIIKRLRRKVNYLEHLADVDKMSTKEGKKPRKPVRGSIKGKRKKGKSKKFRILNNKTWRKMFQKKKLVLPKI